MHSMKKKYDLKSRLHAKLLAASGVVASMAVAGSAMAAGEIDTTAVVATITAVGVAAGAIGVAVLSMHYGIKAYKWIRGAG